MRLLRALTVIPPCTRYLRFPPAAHLRAFATRAELAAARAAASQPAPPVSPAAVSSLFARIDAGLDGMREANGASFRVQRSATRLSIETPKGTFVLEGGADGVTFSSPKGEQGVRVYSLDERLGVWCAVPDGHYLLEMLARDLVYCAKGYPSFDSGL